MVLLFDEEVIGPWSAAVDILLDSVAAVLLSKWKTAVNIRCPRQLGPLGGREFNF